MNLGGMGMNMNMASMNTGGFNPMGMMGNNMMIP